MRPTAALLVAVLATASCNGGGRAEKRTTTTTAPDATTPSTAAPSTTAAPVPSGITLTTVATLDQPLALAVRRGDPALYVAEKGGRVRRVVDGRVAPTPLLDLSGRVSTGGEQGLLGLAWAPDGGAFYVDYTDPKGDTRVVEYRAPATGTQVSAGSGRELLSVDQPYANHNGGQVAFGPDGLLYIALGDGGSGGDPRGNAQHLGRLLGKLLRIDPRPSAGRPYTVPSDNPFVGRAGARPEVWSYGLRNPWRFSFDRKTGDLWIGDVGQNAWEEVDFAPAGSKGHNFGWPAREGTHPFRGGARPPGAVDPVHDYPLDGGRCAVTGGYVYRGRRLAALLDGQYVFADACTGELQALTRDGKVRSLDLEAGFVASFGEDHDGELYVLSLEGPLYRLDPVEAAAATDPVAEADPAGLADQITAAEDAVRDPASPPTLVARSAWEAQVAYRALAARPEWVDGVSARVPERRRATVRANAEAGIELRALTKPQTSLPPWRIVAPAPAEELLGYYRAAEREIGVPWQYLAAIHLVETRMGRIRGTSTAGAQGPMQFLPATWAQYGAGGDIESNRDAILAAARLLRRNGAPGDMANALFNYNRSRRYVTAVTDYAEEMRADERAYHGYYHWQVYYRMVDGDRHLPVGFGT